MKTLSLLLVALTLGPASLSVAGDVILRTSVTPEEAWVGQRVILHIDVLGEDGWAQISDLGSIEVPGAYVMRTESQGTRLQERINGTSYTGQRYELSLYPQRAGALEVPALPVEVTIKSWGVDAENIVYQKKTLGATVMCKVPPGAEGIRGLISTTHFVATQTWEPEKEDVTVGDATKRTITLQATDVSGMAFVPLRYPAIDGVGIYPSEASVNDTSARGSLTGTRTETVTYIFERAGEFKIPHIVLSWWDIETQEIKHIELPGLALLVDAGPIMESNEAAQLEHPRSTPLRRSTWGAVALAVALVLINRRRVELQWSRWRTAREDRESVYYRRVTAAIRSGDSLATLRATMRWLDRINDGHQPARLDHFLRKYGDARAPEIFNRLTHSLASSQETWDAREMSNALALARTRWRRAQREKLQPSALLPEINDPGTYEVRPFNTE